MTTQADRTNWTLPPYNRWSFQRVEQFTRTVRTPRAASPSILKECPTDFSDIAFVDSTDEKITVGEMCLRTYTDGLLVMHQGEILTEQYFNGMDRTTLHLLMSCSKSMTSAIVGVYVDSGAFDLSADIASYIPELAGTAVGSATIQNALDMQVGVIFDENYENRDAEWCHYEVATGWRESSDYDGPMGQLEFAKSLQANGEKHGETFEYKSILTNIVGGCLENAVGKSFTAMLAEHIWDPIGAEQDFVTIVDATGSISFEGGFNICLRDFARFGYLVAQGGEHNDRQLLSRSWLKNCRHPDERLIAAFAASSYGSMSPGGAYHNCWWVRDPERGVITALGINGQILYIDPDNELVVAKFSSQPKQEDDIMEADSILAFEAIAASLAR